MKFNSQICTTREQSERLLALGLKKETADMYYEGRLEGELPRIMPHKTEMDYFNLWDSIIPAWSLHRLLSLLPKYIRVRKESFGRFRWTTLELTIDAEFVVWYREDIDNSEVDENFYAEDIYTSLCDCIEWLIKKGYFPKEYLVDQEAIEEHCKGVLEYLDYIREED